MSKREEKGKAKQQALVNGGKKGKCVHVMIIIIIII